ncbi:MAG: LLM class flavin-dependent oxidoreductase [Hyphomonadaceae bacterium]|nr:LLM class flavin-dependent oxidoreductase [Hyphomonadaceae bacterium]
MAITIPFSVLDLAPISEGASVADALRNARALAHHAERLGYTRYWLAEHHGMAGIASAATSVMIAYAGEGTTRIRLGAGGIMLPNHSPLQIAEQFGTLDAMYPGRIDLGLGRAPGGDQLTLRALRRTLVGGVERFPQEVVELQSYFADPAPDQRLIATPGAGAKVPLWILGSSTFGASLAAALGLPFAFASHFAPTEMHSALAIYREHFRPSEQLAKPYVMLGFNVIAAPTDEAARLLATSQRKAFLSLRRGRPPRRLQPPDPDFENSLGPEDHAILAHVLSASAVGAPETIRPKVEAFIAETGADELMIAAHIFDPAARLRSYELAASLRAGAAEPDPVAAR